MQTELVQLAESSLAAVREEQHVERLVVRQGLLLDRQGKQRRLELEVRFIGHNRLRPRVAPQPLCGGLGSADQISLVGNVGHDDGPGGLQADAKGVVQRRAGLDNIGARITRGA